MPQHPSDTERRKQRDAALRSQDEAIAEHLAQAEASGELRSAESYGKPLADADGYLSTPVEFRMPFKILKNAGVAPAEVALFQRRAELRRTRDAAQSDDERRALDEKLAELDMAIALRLEGMRASGRL